MRGRLLLAGLGVVAGFSTAFTQQPPKPLPPAMSPPQSRPLTPPIQIPKLPESQQRPMPPATPQPGSVAPPQPGLPDGSALPPPVEVPLPYPEDKHPLDAASVTLKRVGGSWQVWGGQRMIRDLGNDEVAAQDIT